ncbi:MAG: putative deoxyribonuclease II, partial [Streblomastix strix]
MRRIWITAVIDNDDKYAYLGSTTGDIVAIDIQNYYLKHFGPVKDKYILQADITANDSPLSRTLLPLYQSNTDVTFMYNDEIPPKTHTDNQANNYGHTKGVIGYAQDEGFWLIHSCPKFPPTPLQQYSYPYSGQEMGQSFLCLTLDSQNLNQVGILQQFNHPLRYVHRITTSASSVMPDLADAMNDSFVRKKDNSTFTILDLNTRNNMRFRGYAKTENFGKELQGQLIAPDIGEDMEWQTWLQSPEDPYCPSQQSKQVYSILNISAPFDPNTYNTQSQKKECNQFR